MQQMTCHTQVRPGQPSFYPSAACYLKQRPQQTRILPVLPVLTAPPPAPLLLCSWCTL